MITVERDVCNTAWMSSPQPATARWSGSAWQHASNLSTHRRIWSFWCESTVTVIGGLTAETFTYLVQQQMNLVLHQWLLVWGQAALGIPSCQTKFKSITKLNKNSPQTAQYNTCYFSGLTFHENAGVCVTGLVDGGVGPQHSLWARGGRALPRETTANSGKSFIFTSNGTKSGCAGFDIPAEFGTGRALLKPAVQAK